MRHNCVLSNAKRTRQARHGTLGKQQVKQQAKIKTILVNVSKEHERIKNHE